ncbi:hypothetical protein [Streptomyces longispororuber]|uniref:hypothetical protein n=1 Tax=Streptomyces longispororuber TaxID=68230 RepID=UPI00210A74CE|nr:hypothetical protein [Streptomyces longispororuber]MCQ4212591.1 hypothetical protein [Streptomyces longispororuber]
MQHTSVCDQAVGEGWLSRRVLGLLVEGLSHRQGYGISFEMLLVGGPEQRDGLRTALCELERYGPLRRERVRKRWTVSWGRHPVVVSIGDEVCATGSGVRSLGRRGAVVYSQRATERCILARLGSSGCSNGGAVANHGAAEVF